MSPEFIVKMINELSEPAAAEFVRVSAINHGLLNNKKTKAELMTACISFILKDELKEKGLKTVLNDMQQIDVYSKYFNKLN